MNSGKKDLIPCNITTPHLMNLAEISTYLKSRATRARKGKDATHNKTLDVTKYLPTFLIGPLLTIICYISLSLNWNIKPLGIKGRPHGPAVVTNVGTFGMNAGFAPLTGKLSIG